VGAAPGGVLEDICLVRGWVPLQVFAVVGEFGQLMGLDVIEGTGERHLAVAVVVAVGFAIGGNVHQLRPVSPVVGETAQQAVRQGFALGEQALEGDGAGDGPVVKEHVDGAPRTQSQLVGRAGVNPPAAGIPPAASPLAHPPGLVGRQ
jgi:hypothetical protein